MYALASKIDICNSLESDNYSSGNSAESIVGALAKHYDCTEPWANTGARMHLFAAALERTVKCSGIESDFLNIQTLFGTFNCLLYT